MTKARVKKFQLLLSKIAWPLTPDGVNGPGTQAAIRKFQQGFAGPGDALIVNGKLNRKTRRAIKWSHKNGGKCSPHFRYGEFRSKGNGDVVIYRPLIIGLEKLRRATGKPIRIVSGYRDPYYNDVVLPSRGIRTAQFSQHKYGTAADLDDAQKITRKQATDAGFTGIGYDGSNGYVEHVDMRHAGPNNATGGRPGAPTTWVYS